MTRYKTMFIFIVTMLCLAMPSEADDSCIWCNVQVSEKFMSCLTQRMMHNYVLKDLPKGLMKDMKLNMLKASNAMTFDELTKENAMKGALTFTIAELIGTSENSDRKITEIIYIFNTCYGFINKLPDEAYLDEMKETLPKIIMREYKTPSNPQQSKNQKLSPRTSKIVKNSYEPRYKNIPLKPVSTSNANANDFSESKEINKRTGFSYDKQQSYQYENNFQKQADISNADANSLKKIRQEQVVSQEPKASVNANEFSQNQNINRWNKYSSDNQQYFQNEENPQQQVSVPNADADSIKNIQPRRQNVLQRPIANQGNAVDSYAASYETSQTELGNSQEKQFYNNYNSQYSNQRNQNALPYRRNTLSNEQNQKYSKNLFISNNQQNNQPNVDSFDYPQNRNPNPYSRQYSEADAFAYSYNARQNNYGKRFTNQNISQKRSSKDKTKSNPNFLPQSDEFTSQQNGPSTKDDTTANALEFVKTLYITINEDNSFKTNFNNFTSKDQAIFTTYLMCYNALISCDYPEAIAQETAENSISFMKTVPERSQTYSYAEAICKMFLIQFNKKNLIGDNPAIQATYLGNAIIKYLENPQMLQDINNKSGGYPVAQQDYKSNKNSENFNDRSSDKVGEITTGSRKDIAPKNNYYYNDNGNINDFVNDDDIYKYNAYGDNDTFADSVNNSTDINDDYYDDDGDDDDDDYDDDDYDDDDDDVDSDKGGESTTESIEGTTIINYNNYDNTDYFYDNPPSKPNKLKQDQMKWKYDDSNDSNFKDISQTSQQLSKSHFPKDDDQESSKSPNIPWGKNDFPVKTDKQKYLSVDESRSQSGVSDSNENPNIKTNKKIANESESKERINILMQKALDCIQDKKFNYSVYNSEIAALAKDAYKTHPDWGAQKSVLVVLIDAIIALSQLLMKEKLKDIYGQQIIMPEKLPSNFLEQNDKQIYQNAQQDNEIYRTEEKKTFSKSIVQEKPVNQRTTDYSPPEKNNVYNPLNEKTEKNDYQINQNSYPLPQQTYVSQTDPVFPNSVPDQSFSSLSQNEAQYNNENFGNRALQSNQNSFSQVNNNNANSQQFQEQINPDPRSWNLKKETFPISQTVNPNAEVPNIKRTQNQFKNQPSQRYSQQDSTNIPNLVKPGIASNWEQNRQINQGLVQPEIPINWGQNNQDNQGLVQPGNPGNWEQNRQINQGLVQPGNPGNWEQNRQINQGLVQPGNQINWGQNSQGNQGLVQPEIPNNWEQNRQNKQDFVKPGTLGNWAPLQQTDQFNSNFEQNKNLPFSQQNEMNQNFRKPLNQGINDVNPANQDFGGMFRDNNMPQNLYPPNNFPPQENQQRWG